MDGTQWPSEYKSYYGASYGGNCVVVDGEFKKLSGGYIRTGKQVSVQAQCSNSRRSYTLTFKSFGVNSRGSSTGDAVVTCTSAGNKSFNTSFRYPSKVKCEDPAKFCAARFGSIGAAKCDDTCTKNGRCQRVKGFGIPNYRRRRAFDMNEWMCERGYKDYCKSSSSSSSSSSGSSKPKTTRTSRSSSSSSSRPSSSGSSSYSRPSSRPSSSSSSSSSSKPKTSSPVLKDNNLPMCKDKVTGKPRPVNNSSRSSGSSSSGTSKPKPSTKPTTFVTPTKPKPTSRPSHTFGTGSSGSSWACWCYSNYKRGTACASLSEDDD